MTARTRSSVHIAGIARSLSAHGPELGDVLLARLLDEIPELRDDDAVRDLLAASGRENITTGLDVLTHGIDISRVEPPAAAAEYARRLAQRVVPFEALQRAYRLGSLVFLEQWFDEVAKGRLEVADAVAVLGSVTQATLRYVDRVSEQLVEIYHAERERWMHNVSAAVAADVRTLLSTTAAVPEEPDLGYRLNRWHVAVIAWADPTLSTRDALARLDRVASALSLRQGDPALVVFADEATLWAWIPAESGEQLSDTEFQLLVGNGHVQLAVGEPGLDLDGFRISHRQARRAQRVACTSGGDASAVTMFAQESLTAFLSEDHDVTRAWVHQVLGPLARDNEQAQRLRETAAVFLETHCSFTETATRLSMHKNTVRYRIRQAESLRGRPLDEDRLRVEVALVACRQLGAAVLAPPDRRPAD